MTELEKKAYTYATNRLQDPNFPAYNWETEISDAYEQGYKDAIDKVHKWINEKWDAAYTHPLVMDAVHKELDEFMEEQQ